MEEIINIVYEKIKSLEAGTEVTILQLIPKESRNKYTNQQLIEVTSKVFMKCKYNKIVTSQLQLQNLGTSGWLDLTR